MLLPAMRSAQATWIRPPRGDGEDFVPGLLEVVLTFDPIQTDVIESDSVPITVQVPPLPTVD